MIINNDQPFDPDQDHRKRHTAAKSDNSSINPEPSFMHFSFPDRDGLDNELAAPVVQELSEHQLLLLCPETLAYALSPKKWSKIQSTHIIDITLINSQSEFTSTTLKNPNHRMRVFPIWSLKEMS